jgi:hypothetical protein
MLSCNLFGGLGNYLFQVAATHSLSIDNNDFCVFNDKNSYTVHKHFNTYTSNIFSNLKISEENFTLLYNEPFFQFKKIPYQKNLKLSGYFQSEKYFNHNRNSILDLFSIDDNSKNYIKNKYDDILNKKTCSVHVRRGDYLNLPNHHPVCSLDYYNKTIEMMDVDLFLVFSDDIEWCRKNFIGDKFIFIDENPDYIDIWLMSLCDNNIIANSSFSWWGAWLNQNENKTVIAPKQWFGSAIQHNTNDLIPETWLRL